MEPQYARKAARSRSNKKVHPSVASAQRRLNARLPPQATLASRTAAALRTAWGRSLLPPPPPPPPSTPALTSAIPLSFTTPHSRVVHAAYERATEALHRPGHTGRYGTAARSHRSKSDRDRLARAKTIPLGGTPTPMLLPAANAGGVGIHLGHPDHTLDLDVATESAPRKLARAKPMPFPKEPTMAETRTATPQVAQPALDAAGTGTNGSAYAVFAAAISAAVAKADAEGDATPPVDITCTAAPALGDTRACTSLALQNIVPPGTPVLMAGVRAGQADGRRWGSQGGNSSSKLAHTPRSGRRKFLMTDNVVILQPTVYRRAATAAASSPLAAARRSSCDTGKSASPVYRRRHTVAAITRTNSLNEALYRTSNTAAYTDHTTAAAAAQRTPRLGAEPLVGGGSAAAARVDDSGGWGNLTLQWSESDKVAATLPRTMTTCLPSPSLSSMSSMSSASSVSLASTMSSTLCSTPSSESITASLSTFSSAPLAPPPNRRAPSLGIPTATAAHYAVDWFPQRFVGQNNKRLSSFRSPARA